uniref:Cytochrome P450 n=1 Tax=Steinernema glaseri TaxID=37863 RepID=A0A1I7ZV56_9BILA
HPEFGYQVVSEDTIHSLGESESRISLRNAKVDPEITKELNSKDLKSCWMKNIGVH